MEQQVAFTEEHRRRVEEFRKRHKTGVLTLLFTDMVGSAALKQELGDAAGGALIDQHRRFVRGLLREFAEVQEIDTAGDSFFIVFIRPSDAARFALRLHAGLRTESRTTPQPLVVRIGIHMGEVFYRKQEGNTDVEDIFSIQVDIAHRVMSLAQGGQTLMTRSVFDNARAILRGEELAELHFLSWLDHGAYRLKGVEEPLAVCEVGEEGLAPLSAPPDSEKAHRHISPDEEPVLGWRPALGQEVATSAGWVLEEKLGEGGFGEIWRARHKKLKEQRVFKFCFRADRVRSLKREVTLFRLLREHAGGHPGIVRLYDVFFDEPPYYISMEWIDGQNLAQWCDGQGGVGQVPLATRLEIVAQTAEALQAAHDAGIIHRDIKPSNILVQPEEASPQGIRVKLTDFGIGQVLSPEALAGVTKAGFTETVGRTEISSRSGTRLYMAPEVIAGQRSTIRSDVYSLGVLFYQLLAGDLGRPLTGDWREDIQDPVLSEDLAHCCAGDPSVRFESAGQLAQAIHSLEERRKAYAEKVRSKRAAVRRRRFAQATAVIFAVLLFAIVALYYGLRRAEHERERAKIAQEEALAQKELAERELYANFVRQAAEAVKDNRFDEARQLLKACPIQCRHWEWGRLQYLCNQDLMTFKCEEGRIIHACFLSNGTPVVTTVNEQKLSVRALETGQVLQTIVLPDRTDRSLLMAGYGADPRMGLAAGMTRRGVLFVWDLKHEVVSWKTDSPGKLVVDVVFADIAFDPHGKYLATIFFGPEYDASSNYYEGALWDAASGTRIRTLYSASIAWGEGAEPAGSFESPQRLRDLAFSPDGKLLRGELGGTAALWATETGEIVKTLVSTAFPVAFSPSGAIVSHYGEQIELLDVQGGGRTALFESPDFADATLLAFSSDEKYMALRAGSTVSIWDSVSKDVSRLLRGHPGMYRAVFSPDGECVLTAGHWEAKVWGLVGGDESLRVGHPSEYHREYLRRVVMNPSRPCFASSAVRVPSHVRHTIWDMKSLRPTIRVSCSFGSLTSALEMAERSPLVFSPDGECFLVSDGDRVQLRDATTGNLLRTLRRSNAGTFAVSRDGRQLAFINGDILKGATAEIWDLELTRQLHTFPVQAGLSLEIPTLSYSYDGKHLAVGNVLWDLETGQKTLEREGRHRLVASPDGTLLARIEEDTCEIWNWEEGTELISFRFPPSAADPLVFGLDGKRLLTGYGGIWDVQSGRELLDLDDSPSGAFLSREGNWMIGTDFPEIVLLPGFPYRNEDYPGDPEAPLEDRIEQYKRDYWKRRLALEAEIRRDLPLTYWAVDHLSGFSIGRCGQGMIETLGLLEEELKDLRKYTDSTRRLLLGTVSHVLASSEAGFLTANLELGQLFNAWAWDAYEEGVASVESCYVALEAYRVAVPEQGDLSWAQTDLASHSADTLAVILRRLGYADEAAAFQRRAVAGCYLTGSTSLDLCKTRLERLGGPLPEHPSGQLVFSDDEHRNDGRGKPGVREYLERVAPLPDLEKTEAHLRVQLPPPLPPDAKLEEIVSPLLEEIEKLYAEQQTVTREETHYELDELDPLLTVTLNQGMIEVLNCLRFYLTDSCGVALLRSEQGFPNLPVEACAQILASYEIDPATSYYALGRQLNEWAWDAYQSKDIATPGTALMALAAYLLAVPGEKDLNWRQTVLASHCADTLAVILHRLGYADEAAAFQRRAVAGCYLTGSTSLGLYKTRLARLGGPVPGRPSDQIVFSSEERRTDSPGKPGVSEYLDRVAPLPDLDELEANLRVKLPPPLPPKTTLAEIIVSLLEQIRATMAPTPTPAPSPSPTAVPVPWDELHAVFRSFRDKEISGEDLLRELEGPQYSSVRFYRGTAIGSIDSTTVLDDLREDFKIREIEDLEKMDDGLRFRLIIPRGTQCWVVCR